MTDSGPSRRSSVEPERLHTVFSRHQTVEVCWAASGTGRLRPVLVRVIALRSVSGLAGPSQGQRCRRLLSDCISPGRTQPTDPQAAGGTFQAERPQHS